MVQMEGKAARARLTDRDGHASAGPDHSTGSAGESALSVATGQTVVKIWLTVSMWNLGLNIVDRDATTGAIARKCL